MFKYILSPDFAPGEASFIAVLIVSAGFDYSRVINKFSAAENEPRRFFRASKFCQRAEGAKAISPLKVIVDDECESTCRSVDGKLSLC